MVHHRLRRTIAFLGAAISASALATPAIATPVPAGAKYVALGDSFAAVGSLSELQVPPSPLCGQAKDNYAHAVAQKLGLQLTDATCGWATTEDYWIPQLHPLPGTAFAAQRDAVTPDTDLVTLTFGGNDNLADKYISACMTGFVTGIGPTCRELISVPTSVAISSVGQKVQAVIADVQKRAPHAKVMVAGYYELASANLECAQNIPQRAEDRQFLADFIAQLNTQLKQAADATGATFVAAPANGQMCTDSTSLIGLDENAIPFHPTGIGQNRMADAIIAKM